MSDGWLRREFKSSLLWWLYAVVVVSGLYAIGFLGVVGAALAVLLLGAGFLLMGLRWAPVGAVGLVLTWLAMAVLFIERSIAFDLNGWVAAACWFLVSVVAVAIYQVREPSLESSSRVRRLVLFYAVWVAWPATALVFLGVGAAMGVRAWISLGAWIATSLVAPLVIYRVRNPLTMPGRADASAMPTPGSALRFQVIEQADGTWACRDGYSELDRHHDQSEALGHIAAAASEHRPTRIYLQRLNGTLLIAATLD